MTRATTRGYIADRPVGYSVVIALMLALTAVPASAAPPLYFERLTEIKPNHKVRSFTTVQN